MDDPVCKFIPWFRAPTVTPKADRYWQGDLTCAVMTEEGRRCGSADGITRCRDYCKRAMDSWQDHLLPIAMRMMRNEVASVYSPDRRTWVPATTRFSNAAAWRKKAEEVQVELIGYRGRQLIYHGVIHVTPATKRGQTVIDIVSDKFSPGSIALIRSQLRQMAHSGCHVESSTIDRITIRAPHKMDLTVGHAVSLGTRILLLDAIAQLDQPFTVVGRYTLPGVRDSSQFETDDGTVPSYSGVRLGGLLHH